MQAQDPRGFRLAVRARTRGLTVRDVEAALDSGELVVSWLNRGTLHLVRAEDYWLLHGLTTPQLATGSARRLAQEGVRDPDRAVDAVVNALASGPATRATRREAVRRAGGRVEGPALVHVLFQASLRGLVVRGPMAGKEQAYVLAADWLPRARPFDRDAALAELGARYLRAHAPADERDLAKWAGIPLGQARRALAGVKPPRGSAAVPGPTLLGAFDEVLMGWSSRQWVVGPHEAKLVNGGLFRPFALVDGRAVATWRLEKERVVVTPFADVDVSVFDAEARDVERFRYAE